MKALVIYVLYAQNLIQRKHSFILSNFLTDMLPSLIEFNYLILYLKKVVAQT